MKVVFGLPLCTAHGSFDVAEFLTKEGLKRIRSLAEASGMSGRLDTSKLRITYVPILGQGRCERAQPGRKKALSYQLPARTDPAKDG